MNVNAVEELNELELRGSPRNESAERGVIGSCFIDPEVIDDVALTIRERDFYVPHNQKIFRAILELYENGKRPDVLLTVDHLKKTGSLGAAGGLAYLTEIAADEVPTAHNALYYAQIVRDYAILRDIIDVGASMLHMAKEATSADARELIGRAERLLFGILDARQTNNACRYSDILIETLSAIDKRIGSKEPEGVCVGFSDVDELVGGLRNGELVILAARPGMGKSAFATNVMERISIEADKTVLFFSLEMHRLELSERILCGRARVNNKHARNGNLDPAERSRLTQQSNYLCKAPIFIDDSPSRTVSEIGAVCRRQKRRHGLDLVIVDYLQRIHPEDSRIPREQQVAAIATRLKTLARELNVPVLCLAQLNRQIETQADKRPRLNHLRESGAIEQEADQVWFIHRPDYYESDESRHTHKADIYVEKNRAGATGKVSLAWFAEWTRFESCADESGNVGSPRYKRQFGNGRQRKTPQTGGTEFNADEWDYPGGESGN